MNHVPAPAPILSRLGETCPDSGLRIPGQYVWCSSVIQAEGKWHMFSAAWRNGVRLVSDDGAHWSFCLPEIRAYGGLIRWTTGASTLPTRRERPSLILQNGEPTHLVNGVLLSDGETYTARSIVTPLSATD